MADKQALVDSGATDNFMHPNFAKRMGLGIVTIALGRTLDSAVMTTQAKK
jgi:hypothetical protein